MPLDFEKWHMEQTRNRPRSRWSVRLLGLGIVLTILWMAASPFIPVNDPDTLSNNLWVVSLPAVFGAGLSPFARTMWSGTKAEANFDEFEATALSAATAKAYYLLLTLCLAVALWCWMASIFGTTAPSRPFDWSAIFLGTLFLGVELPAFIAELTVPFPPAIEEDPE